MGACVERQKNEMRQRTVSLVSSILLLPISLFLVATGLVSDTMDLNEFVYHEYAGYIFAGLSVIHVYVNWPQLRALWQSRTRQFSSNPVPVKKPEQRSVVASKEESPKGVEQSFSSPKKHPTRREVLKLVGAGVVGFFAGWLLRRPAEAASAASMAGQDVGMLYHRWSTPGYADAISAVLNWGRQPSLYKDYAWAERHPLPPVESPAMLLSEAITQRRSLRDYANRTMTLAELSWLLHSTSGITAPAAGLRAAPSAGAQYPLETYVVVNRLEGLPTGIYHYAVAEHAVASLRQGEFGPAIMHASLGQAFVAQADVVIVLTAILQRLRWRYRERSYRYALLEAGHVGQNIYLAAEAVGMGACAVGAYFDDDVNELLEIDGEQEFALYLVTVGSR